MLRKKANWAQDSNNLTLAADFLMASGDYEKALHIMMENNWVDKYFLFITLMVYFRVIYAARKVDRSNATLLREIGQFLAKNNHFTTATAIFMRINDIKSILHMHMNAENWEDVRNF